MIFLQVEREMGVSAGIVAVDRAGVDDVLEAFPGGRLPGAEEVVETSPRPLPGVLLEIVLAGSRSEGPGPPWAPRLVAD